MKTKVFIKRWSNGKKMIEYLRKGDKRHGFTIRWHYSGFLKSIILWKENEQIWTCKFPSLEFIENDVEIELFFHPMPEFS